MSDFKTDRDEIAWTLGALKGFGPTLWALVSESPQLFSEQIAVDYENAVERLGRLVLGKTGYDLGDAEHDGIGSADSEFGIGELFVYVNGSNLELGYVKRQCAEKQGYFCYYSTGDTAARTPTDHMLKLDNAGYTRIEGMYRKVLEELAAQKLLNEGLKDELAELKEHSGGGSSKAEEGEGA